MLVIFTVTAGSLADVGEMSARHSVVNIEKEDGVVKDFVEGVSKVHLWLFYHQGFHDIARIGGGIGQKKERINLSEKIA